MGGPAPASSSAIRPTVDGDVRYRLTYGALVRAGAGGARAPGSTEAPVRLSRGADQTGPGVEDMQNPLAARTGGAPPADRWEAFSRQVDESTDRAGMASELRTLASHRADVDLLWHTFEKLHCL